MANVISYLMNPFLNLTNESPDVNIKGEKMFTQKKPATHKVTGLCSFMSVIV
ncbi:hypothetical protein KDU71_06835 [Carboxylicivirga sediminis]|uniref:Uncharacterized protein n=1 Tax=Carboxylicivirga sediminis TaxID=2006564 RepID=A0A941F364_9BACT|nr:hypothetical protein [Carboxylicivirga sediminis]MBR8535268.1 hypothetical protein [Carboxylicivirga sediminis]